jgi:hypothetical protein
MKAQEEFLDAVERRDVEKLRQIHAKYAPKRKDAGPLPSDNICKFMWFQERVRLIAVQKLPKYILF